MSEQRVRQNQIEAKAHRNTKIPRLKVRVTAEIIANAVRRDSRHCMISNAIQQDYPNLRWVLSDTQTIRVSDYQAGYRYKYLNPPIGIKSLIRFDQGLKVQPFDMVLGGNNCIITPVRKDGRPTWRAFTPKGQPGPTRPNGAGAALGMRPAGWRDGRKRSGKHRGNPKPQRLSKIRKFGQRMLED